MSKSRIAPLANHPANAVSASSLTGTASMIVIHVERGALAASLAFFYGFQLVKLFVSKIILYSLLLTSLSARKPFPFPFPVSQIACIAPALQGVMIGAAHLAVVTFLTTRATVELCSAIDAYVFRFRLTQYRLPSK